ncbi:MAG: hypothetical protein HYS14_04120 [Candidatus Rokubacteria bacterium]|nr:hypothetical protein [Candidatus Rokubacteria bacterium]
MLTRQGIAILVITAFVVAQPSFLAVGADKEVTLRSGTPIFLVFDQSIDSETGNEGDTIYLRVMRPVQVEGVVVIRSGEKVRTKLTEVRKAKGWGRRGDITVRVESTSAVDGQEILLSATQRREGEGRGGAATAVGVGAGLICLPAALLGFAIKGEEGRIPIGFEVKAYVDSDQKIKIAAGEELSPAEEMKRAKELEKEIAEKAQREREEKEKKEKEAQQQPTRQ